MAGRLIKVSGVANLQVSQVVYWAKICEEVTLTPESTPPGADEWTFRASGGDVDGFLSNTSLAPCKGYTLTITEAVPELLVEAFCDVEPLGDWLDPAEICKKADVQTTWKLVEDTTAPTPYVYRVVSGLVLGEVADAKLMQKKGGEKRFIRFRVYQRPATSPTSPPPPPSSPLIKRIVIVHDGENCPIYANQPRLGADGRFLVEHGKPVWDDPRMPVQFHSLYDLVLQRIISLAHDPTTAARVDVRTLDVQWFFVYAPHGTPPEWLPSRQCFDEMSELSIKFEQAPSKKGQVDTFVQKRLSSVRDEYLPGGRGDPEGLIFALLSGDRDFGLEIKSLREGDHFPVCMLYPKGQASERFLKYFSGRESDCWQELIARSRPGARAGAGGGAGSAAASGSSLAARARSNTGGGPPGQFQDAAPRPGPKPDNPRPPEPARAGNPDIVEVRLILELLRFFLTSENLVALEDQFRSQRFDLTAKLAGPGSNMLLLSRADSSSPSSSPSAAAAAAAGMRVRLPTQDEAEECLKTFKDSLVRDEVQVDGIAPYDLKNEQTHAYVAGRNKVTVFIPGAGKAAAFAAAAGVGSTSSPGGVGAGASSPASSAVKLYPNQLFVRFEGTLAARPWDERKMIDFCQNKFQVTVFKMTNINGHWVVALDMRADVRAAKLKLLEQRKVPQLRFSESAGPQLAAPSATPLAPQRRLPPNQLLFRGAAKLSVMRSECDKKGVTLQSIDNSPDGSSIATFAAHAGKHLDEARATLLGMGARYMMMYPEEWEDDRARAWVQSEGLDQFKINMPNARPQVGTRSPFRWVFFGDKRVLGRLGDKKLFGDVTMELQCCFIDPAYSTPTSTPTFPSPSAAGAVAKQSTAILLSLPGPRAHAWVSEVKEKLEELGTAERQLLLPPSQTRNKTSEEWAKKQLIMQAMPGLKSKYKAQNVNVHFFMNEGKLVISGKAAKVKEADKNLQTMFGTIKVKFTDFRAPMRDGEPNWHAATVATIRRVWQTPTNERHFSYAVDKTTADIVFCWWGAGQDGAGVDDALASLQAELRKFCAAYHEARWTVAETALRQGEAEAGVAERLEKAIGEAGVQKFCEGQGVAYAPWDSTSKAVLLCGHRERVEETIGALNHLCRPARQLTRQIQLSETLRWLLEHKRNKEKLAALRAVGPRMDVVVTFGDPIEIRGEHDKVVAADGEMRSELEHVLTCSTAVALNRMQQAFLATDSGKDLLGKLWDDFAACTTQARKASTCLAKASLPNGVVVEVWHGDILANEPQAKALVNSANESLLKNHVSGIAGAIRRAGGQGLVDDCLAILARQGPIPAGSVVTTRAHLLAQKGFECILHAVPPRSTDNTHGMLQTVQEILRAAVAQNSSSVVVPVLGSGIYGWPLSVITTLVMRAIVTWASNDPLGGLQRIVLMDNELAKCQQLADSLGSFDDADDDDPDVAEAHFTPPAAPEHKWEWKDNHGWVTYDYDQSLELDLLYKQLESNPGRSLKQMLLGDKGGKPSQSPHKEPGQQFARYDVEMQFDGSGELQALQRNRATQFARPIRKQPLAPEAALSEIPLYKERCEEAKEGFDRMCRERATDMAKPGGFDRWFTPLPAGQVTISDNASLTFTALENRHCEEASSDLRKKLQGAECSQEETFAGALQLFLKDAAPAAAAAAARQHFDDFVAAQGEDAVPLEVHMTARGEDLDVKLTSLGQSNLTTGKYMLRSWIKEVEHAVVARRAEVAFPEWWRSVDKNMNELHFLEVPQDSEEFKKVVRRMRDETGIPELENTARKNMFGRQIVKVEQVINRPLWRSYFRFRQDLAEPWNEVWVKHGTGATDPKIVCDTGFNRGFSRPDTGNMWGVGIYTAENAQYSHDGYVGVGQAGEKQMLLCQFAAGKVYRPESAYSSEARQTKAPPKGFDSIRGIVRRTSNGEDFALISYRDNQIYPSYLVTYQ